MADDSEFYLQAIKEDQFGRRDPAIWAKAEFMAEGDRSRAQRLYVQLRVEQLAEFAQDQGAESKGTKPGEREQGGERDRNFGVKGWLLVLAIYLTIILPVVAVFLGLPVIAGSSSEESREVRAALGNTLDTYRAVRGYGLLLLALLSFWSGLKVWRKSRNADGLALNVLWMIVLFFAGEFFWLTISSMSRGYTGDALYVSLVPYFLGRALPLLLPAVVLIIYLKTSRRVEVTFGGSRPTEKGRGGERRGLNGYESKCDRAKEGRGHVKVLRLGVISSVVIGAFLFIRWVAFVGGNTAPAPANTTQRNDVFGFYFANNCEHPLTLALRYEDVGGQWRTTGWWDFDALSSGYLQDANGDRLSTANPVWYYYARSTDGSNLEWQGQYSFPYNKNNLPMASLMDKEGDREWAADCE